jgi:predicted phage tail protein
MTTKLNWVFGICLMLLISSCGSSDKKEKLDKDEMIAKDFAIKYNAVNNWDTIASYTSHFQKLFISQNKLMIFKGRIYDIVKTDSNYIVKVLDERIDATHNFLAIITFTNQQLDAAYTGNKSATGVFVIKVSKVTTSNPSIKEVEDRDENDNSYTYTHLSDDADQMLTIFTGTSIDCQLEEFDESN